MAARPDSRKGFERGRTKATPDRESGTRTRAEKTVESAPRRELGGPGLARGEAQGGYAELFELAPVGYVTLTPDERVGEMNRAGARLLGVERGRAVGQPFEAFVAPSDREAFRTLLDHAQHEGGASLVLWTRTEPAVAVRATVSCVDRGSRRFLVAFEDVTEQSAREERLVRAEEDLREADRRKDEFLAMLSHELRNPLAPIRNSIYLLARMAPQSAEAQRAHAVIERQIAQMTRLVDDLLDVTRIRKGKSQLMREHVELAGLARMAVEDHRTSFEAAGLGLETQLDGGPFWIDGDPARLVQVLSNLLGNAKKFTLPGGVVTVSLGRRQERVALCIRDTGVGIEPGDIEGLFQPFRRPPEARGRARSGLGLGLSMVKGFIELHGGTVDVASDGLGKGTRVMVDLPLQPAPAAPMRVAAGKPGRPRRVLVIDDNADCADMLKEGLGLGRHEARVAYDGRSGLALARAFLPDVVICDIGLPEMDGYEVARAFRADEALRAVYLIALTGYARLEDRRRAALAGFNEHVAKPPSVEVLERLLGEAP